MPSIRDIDDPLRRDEALQEVRRVSGVDERVLRQVLERRLAATGPGRAGDHQSRISADSVLSSPDALPVRDILRGVSPVESELLRLLLFVPDLQLRVVDELGPDRLPSTLARELYRAIVLQRAPNDDGVHPPFDRDALLLTLDDETRSLAQALYAVGGPMPEAREIDRLLIDLEIEQIRDLADYNEAALLEAEREGDAEAIATLMAKGRQINETRRSLDRRRDQTRLLAGPRR
jgi:hypothetical protein